MSEELFSRRGGYRRLDTFMLATIAINNNIGTYWQ